MKEEEQLAYIPSNVLIESAFIFLLSPQGGPQSASSTWIMTWVRTYCHWGQSIVEAAGFPQAVPQTLLNLWDVIGAIPS